MYLDAKVARVVERAVRSREVAADAGDGSSRPSRAAWGAHDWSPTHPRVVRDSPLSAIVSLVGPCSDEIAAEKGRGGPADLARCLLIDALGLSALCDGCDGSGRMIDEFGQRRCWHCDGDRIGRRVEANDQSFKQAFVVHWGDDWMMSHTQILEWITSRASR